jgi:hypothetical protein
MISNKKTITIDITELGMMINDKDENRINNNLQER